MSSLRSWALAGWLFLLCLATAGAGWAQPRPRVDKAADLPRFSYKLQGRLDELVRSEQRFAPLALAIRRDVEFVLAQYEIADHATLRDLHTLVGLLDFLDGRYADAVARAEQARALQDKPADKLLSGLRLRVMSAAAQEHGLGTREYRQAVAEGLARELETLPFEVVGSDVRELKSGSDWLSEALLLGPVREVMQPIARRSGELSSDFAPGLVGVRFSLVGLLPLKDVFTEVFGAYLKTRQVARPDIWADRDVALAEGLGLAPVPLAVWDSGVDTTLFPQQLQRDARGRPLVIAFDRFARPARGALMPLPQAMRKRLPEMAARTKGFADLEAGVDSPEAAAVQRLLGSLAPDEYVSAMEQLGLAGNYEHGTHVAGIALAGNPYARLVVGRLEFDHRLKPDPCPSLALARREAAATLQTVAFFRQHGVRVVNMSWGGNLADTEAALEQCGIGGTPAERSQRARRYFEISRQALVQAFTGAPEILFVTAAGNSGDDASFVEDIPAALELPNLLTVGAVDSAGDEAGFTSDGPTVKVHANGTLVESVIPGGQRVALSGTSMAAPQVANLAAKMLAVNPALTPPELIRLIVETAGRTADGRRQLLHPRKALEAARR